jgi:AraC-like DNA-binding protein
LNALRIENACKLLVSDNESTILEIAELSGYNNLSNFNRQFQAIKQQSPSEFKKNNKL